MKSKDKDYLMRFLELYDHPSIALWRAVEARHFSQILQRIKVDGLTLDLGCGDGVVSKVVFDQMTDVGLELEVDEARKAKLKKSHNSLMVADARCLPFVNESFGLVASNCVIEHIPNVENVIWETSRVLKKGGYFVFTVPSEFFGRFLLFYVLFSKLGLKKIAKYYSIKRNESLNHYNCYDIVTWTEKIKNAGLTMVEFNFYLSKSAIKVWDFLAICVFSMRKIGMLKSSIMQMLLAKTRKMRISVLQKIFCKYYNNQNCEIGGGLSFVVRKK